MLLKILTSAERNFMDHYAQEILALERGSAFHWLREHQITTQDFAPFIEARQSELAAQNATAYPPKPDHFEIPWESVEAFMGRRKELGQTLELLRANKSHGP